MEQEAHLLETLKSKNIRQRLSPFIHRMKKANEKLPWRDTSYLERKRDLAWEEYQLEVAERPSGDLYLRELISLTDIAYYSRKLRQVCLLVAQQSVYRVDYVEDLEQSLSFLPLLQERGLLELPAIGVYYYGYLLFKDSGDASHFSRFKTLLLAHAAQFHPSERRELILMAINFCVRKLNQGDRNFFQEVFELYKAGLEQETLLENSQLSRFTYHNVVIAGLNVKEYDWVREFIFQYKAALEDAYQEASFQYNLARWEFETGDLASAQERLLQAHFSDILLNLSAKTISLKIYFQQSEFDLLQAHIHAMNKFIRRNKVIGYHKQNYLNLLRYTTKLINLNPYDRSDRERLKQEVQSVNPLTERQWILSQLEEV